MHRQKYCSCMYIWQNTAGPMRKALPRQCWLASPRSVGVELRAAHQKNHMLHMP